MKGRKGCHKSHPHPTRRKEGEAEADRDVETGRDVFPLMWTENDRSKGCVLEVEVTQ